MNLKLYYKHTTYTTNMRYFSIYKNTYTREFSKIHVQYIHDIQNFCINYISNVYLIRVKFISKFYSYMSIPCFTFACTSFRLIYQTKYNLQY